MKKMKNEHSPLTETGITPLKWQNLFPKLLKKLRTWHEISFYKKILFLCITSTFGPSNQIHELFWKSNHPIVHKYWDNVLTIFYTIYLELHFPTHIGNILVKISSFLLPYLPPSSFHIFVYIYLWGGKTFFFSKLVLLLLILTITQFSKNLPKKKFGG